MVLENNNETLETGKKYYFKGNQTIYKGILNRIQYNTVGDPVLYRLTEAHVLGQTARGNSYRMFSSSICIPANRIDQISEEDLDEIQSEG